MIIRIDIIIPDLCDNVIDVFSTPINRFQNRFHRTQPPQPPLRHTSPNSIQTRIYLSVSFIGQTPEGQFPTGALSMYSWTSTNPAASTRAFNEVAALSNCAVPSVFPIVPGTKKMFGQVFDAALAGMVLSSQQSAGRSSVI